MYFVVYYDTLTSYKHFTLFITCALLFFTISYFNVIIYITYYLLLSYFIGIYIINIT